MKGGETMRNRETYQTLQKRKEILLDGLVLLPEGPKLLNTMRHSIGIIHVSILISPPSFCWQAFSCRFRVVLHLYWDAHSTTYKGLLRTKAKIAEK